ncbi:TolC family protein [Paraburkholderia sp. EG285A]|uniref:TolC family protein n=1 Tax=Paraburkholderia sp. EG285A TaxID=3237009 RepID=UPI0034D2B5A7
MNGKRASSRLRGIVILLGLFVGARAHSSGVPDLLEDPLLTRPPLLSHGAILQSETPAVTCPAAIDLARPLTLAGAVDIGLCNNPQIGASFAAIKAQAAAVGEARASYLPTLSADVSPLRTRTQYPDSPISSSTANGHTLSAGVAWRMFDFGARAASGEAANRSLQAALASHDASIQKVMSDIVEAYFNAQMAQATLAARAESTSMAQQTYEAVERRQRMGVAEQSDSLQAATALAKAKLAEQQAAADDRVSNGALLYFLGVAPSTELRLAGLEDAATSHVVEDLNYWLEETATRHPAIIAAREQWKAARAEVKVARSEGLPTIDLVGNFYQNGYQNQGMQAIHSNTTTVGITVTIPFFDGFSSTYKVRRAQAQAEQSESQLHDTEQQVLTDVIKAQAEAVAAAGKLQAAKELLRAARSAVASSRRRYDKGVANILELLSVQSALADAQQERVRSVAEWESDRVKLRAAAGALDRSAIGDHVF